MSWKMDISAFSNVSMTVFLVTYDHFPCLGIDFGKNKKPTLSSITMHQSDLVCVFLFGSLLETLAKEKMEADNAGGPLSFTDAIIYQCLTEKCCWILSEIMWQSQKNEALQGQQNSACNHIRMTFRMETILSLWNKRYSDRRI